MSDERRQRYHHGDLPAALLAAVAEQIQEGGVSEVGLRETARRAGVSHAAPAHHFGDLQGLLTAFAIQGHRMLARELVDRLNEIGEADTRTYLVTVGVTYVTFAVEHPSHFAVMFRPDVIDPDDPALQAAGQPNFDVLLAAVTAHQADGWRPDRDPLELAVMTWSSIHGLTQLWLGGLVDERLRQGGIATFARSLLDLILD